MKNRLRVVCAAVLICGTTAWATDRGGNQPQHFQRNQGGGNTGPLCAASTVTLPDGVLAVIVVPGPADMKDTWFEIRNYAPERLAYATFSGFGALGGKGLCFDSAEPLAHPQGGKLRVEHPARAEEGMGPAMMVFSGFDAGECAGFQAVIGTWGDPEFRAQVADLTGARVDLVFDGEIRASGEFQLCNGSHIRDKFHELVACEPGSVVAVVAVE